MTHKQRYNLYLASCDVHGCIYHYVLNEEGVLAFQDKTALDRPMYLTIENKKLYVLLRRPFAGSTESGLLSFDIASDGSLTNPSEILSTKGEVACHLLADKGQIYCVNYTSGSVIQMPERLVQHQGHSVNPLRQESPHTHFVGLTPDQNYLCVTDLGLDQIMVYTKQLELVSIASVPPGHGPRHLAFSVDGSLLFCANELKSTVSVFAYHHDGSLTLKETVNALPDSFEGFSTIAAIRVRGDKLYVSHRGYDAISCLQYTDHLELIGNVPCGGNSPRDFDLFGDYLICTNETSDNVTVFRIDSGRLQQVPQTLGMKAPLCVVGEPLSHQEEGTSCN